MDQFSHIEIENLMNIEDNKKCFDCGNNHPKWASLNNGIFVCIKCAGLHRSLGVRVSFIRSLTIDSWDDSELLYLKFGGNERFRNFLNEFQVPSNATMDFKYMIRASDYYRRLLKSEVNKEEPPFKPDIIAGLEMLDYGINNGANFVNSNPICFNAAVETSPPKSGFFYQVGSFFSKAKDTVKTTANNLGHRIKEMELGDKLKNTGDKTLAYMKTTGDYVIEKGKEAYQSDFVQTVAARTEEGINIIVEKTKQILKNDQLNNDHSSFEPYHQKENFENCQELVDKSSESFVNVVHSPAHIKSSNVNVAILSEDEKQNNNIESNSNTNANTNFNVSEATIEEVHIELDK